MRTKTSDQTREIILVGDPEATLDETRKIAGCLLGGNETAVLDQSCEDVALLFKGEYPGYRSSNTKYHNFEHTLSVVLAAARLIHGCSVDGYEFSPREILLTLIASLFHDVGLIQEESDRNGSGAKYTVGHEERSISFLRKYLLGKGFSAADVEICANWIRCTILSFAPQQIPFTSKGHQTLGFIVGTADLMAQMADRLYLEKLLLLYKEFEEARLPGFDSELELLQKTKDFFEIIAQKRLAEDLGGVSRYMRTHFKNWLNVDQDLYNESIENNIAYLESLVDVCGDSLPCYLENLRRGGIGQERLGALDMDVKK